jgi:hypothetical protein
MPSAVSIHECSNSGNILYNACFFPCFELEIILTGMPLVADMVTSFSFSRPSSPLTLLQGMSVVAFSKDASAALHPDGKVRDSYLNSINIAGHLIKHCRKP